MAATPRSRKNGETWGTLRTIFYHFPRPIIKALSYGAENISAVHIPPVGRVLHGFAGGRNQPIPDSLVHPYSRFEPARSRVAGRSVETLNARSLHSTDHRFATICFGRDDRVGEIRTSPVKPRAPGSFARGFPIREKLVKPPKPDNSSYPADSVTKIKFEIMS